MANSNPDQSGIKKPSGRPPGTPNKTTVAVKAAIEQAFNEAHPKGPVAYLKEVAKDDPKTFLALVGKLIPKEIKGTLQVNFMDDIMNQLYGDKAQVIEHEDDKKELIQ